MSTELNPTQKAVVHTIYSHVRPMPEPKPERQGRFGLKERIMDRKLSERHFAVLMQEARGRRVANEVVYERLAAIHMTADQKRLEEIRAQLEIMKQARK